MSQFIRLHIILFCSIILYEKANCQKPEVPIDYAKLELNKDELLGSRWAIDNDQIITVYHGFQIVDVVKVDVNDMSIRIDFHVRQRWEANGLDFPKGLFKDKDPKDIYISADENVLKSVWSPDSYIPNARETKIMAIAAAQSAVNIFRNKTIIYKARMHAVLGCSFTFQWYPLDIQVCDLVFESYKYSTNEVRYEWEPNDPVTALDGIILYQYDFFLPPKRSKTNIKRWTGLNSYPQVKMTFKFERKLGNNVIQVFIPTMIIVILSFFSFWLGLDAVPGRISLLITCILTIVTMHSGLKGVVPAVHYIKMMDIWMIGCMIFVFGAICEFIIVKYLKWRSELAKKSKDEREKLMKENGLGGNQSEAQWAQKGQALQNSYMQKMRVEAELQRLGIPSDYPPGFIMPGVYNNPQFMMQKPYKPIWVQIDRISRVLFPILFAIFNAAFWPILLVGAGKQHAEV